MAIPNERHGHSPRRCALQQAGEGRCGRNCEKGHGPSRDLSAWESISGDAVHVAWYSGGTTLVLPSLQEGTQACPVFLPHGDTMTLAWGTGYSSVRTGMLNILPHSQCRISSRLNFALASRAGRSLIPVLLSLLERHGPHFPTHPFSSWFTLFQFCLLCASLIICIYFTEPQCVKRDFSEPFRVSTPVAVSHHPWALLSPLHFSCPISPQDNSIICICHGSATHTVVFQPLSFPFELHHSLFRSLPLSGPLIGQVFFYPQISELPFPDATSASSPSL